MALFPGPRWGPDEIATGLIRHGFTGWSVRTMGAITMAESAGYVWAHGLNRNISSGAAFLAEGHGLLQPDDYWTMRVWRSGDRTPGGRLMAPYWAGERSFSQLAKDPEWNLAMAREVFLLNALVHGYANAYAAGWTSYEHGRHVQFLAEAGAAARRAGAIP